MTQFEPLFENAWLPAPCCMTSYNSKRVPACRPLAFSIVLTDREPGTGQVSAYVPHSGQHCPGILMDLSQAIFWISQSKILWQLCFPASHLHCWQMMLVLSADSCKTSALWPSLYSRPFILQLGACGLGSSLTGNNENKNIKIEH